MQAHFSYRLSIFLLLIRISTMKQIISLFAHPQLRHSRVHKRLLQVQVEHPQVLVRDLYELYPDFIVNVESEQSILKMAILLFGNFQFIGIPCLPF